MKKVNWFKKTFGKRNWETIYTCDCTAKRGIAFCGNYDVKAKVILQIDKERNETRCYYTDGDLKSSMDISFLATQIPSVIPVLKQYNIKF